MAQDYSAMRRIRGKEMHLNMNVLVTFIFILMQLLLACLRSAQLTPLRTPCRTLLSGVWRHFELRVVKRF